MSRTIGHSDPRRPATDFYETPEWCTRAVCRWLMDHVYGLAWATGGVASPATILDPGAGSGAISRVLRQKWPEAFIDLVDCDAKHEPALRKFIDSNVGSGTYQSLLSYQIVDFLLAGVSGGYVPSVNGVPPFDPCVCNPPFSGPHREDLAFAFIEKAMRFSKVGAFLTRLNWLAAAPTKAKRERYRYLKANPPCVLVMGRRPSFTQGGTDATEYCWLVWGVPGTESRWEMLDCGWEKP